MTKAMKKLILIFLTWIIFTDANYPAEWYEELYTHGNTTVKFPRDEIQEARELLNGSNNMQNEPFYLIAKTHAYKMWENDCKLVKYDSMLMKIDSVDYGQLYEIRNIYEKFNVLKHKNRFDSVENYN